MAGLSLDIDVYFRCSRAWQEKSHPPKLMCSVFCLVPAPHMSCLVWLCSCICNLTAPTPFPQSHFLSNTSCFSLKVLTAAFTKQLQWILIYISAFSTYHVADKTYLQFVVVSLFYSSLLLCLDFFPSNSAKKPPFLSNPASTLTLLRSFPPQFS